MSAMTDALRRRCTVLGAYDDDVRLGHRGPDLVLRNALATTSFPHPSERRALCTRLALRGVAPILGLVVPVFHVEMRWRCGACQINVWGSSRSAKPA